MKREIQLIFAALLIGPLDYILLDDYKNASITLLSVLIAFLIWYFQEKIRDNYSLMRLFRKLF